MRLPLGKERSRSPGSKPIVTALTIASDSGVGRRRTQVILHLLREAGFIRRTQRGYALKTKHLPSNEAFQALLHTYTDRATSDKTRLAEMMHYAEVPSCRTKVIRAYFDEPAGEPCMRCDNCLAAHPEDRRSCSLGCCRCARIARSFVPDAP